MEGRAGDTRGGEGVISRMAINDNKAGMEGLDRDKINKIILETSKGSRFYENELKKEQQVNQRIERMLQQKALITEQQLLKAQAQVEKMAADLERRRDLERVIVHVDMDAFYAAVEMRDRPELKDKPMAVGSLSMLSTSNYCARRFGVRAAMPGFIAKKLCPSLTIVPLNFEKYRAVSAEVREIFADYDPSFLPLSLDEAYLDISQHLRQRRGWPESARTHSARVWPTPAEGESPGDPEGGGLSPVLFEDAPASSPVVFGTCAEEAVREMRFRIEQRTGLTASAGIAPNMMLAKVCSDKNKPNGQYRIPAERQAVMDFIQDLPIRKISGIGKVTEHMLRALEITTCSELHQKVALLSLLFSEVSWHHFLQISLGLGSTCFERDCERKSMSTESIDASSEDGSLGRLVNDDQIPNAKMKKIEVDGMPHRLFSIMDISEGQEITYDHGRGDMPWRSCHGQEMCKPPMAPGSPGTRHPSNHPTSRAHGSGYNPRPKLSLPLSLLKSPWIWLQSKAQVVSPTVPPKERKIVGSQQKAKRPGSGNNDENMDTSEQTSSTEADRHISGHHGMVKTFGEMSRAEEHYEQCRELCRDLAKDLQKEDLKGKTVTLKLKNVNFEVKTRASTLSSVVSTEEEIFATAKELLKTEIDSTSPRPLRLRLMGVRVSGFVSGEDRKSLQKSIVSFLQSGGAGGSPISKGAPDDEEVPHNPPPGGAVEQDAVSPKASPAKRGLIPRILGRAAGEGQQSFFQRARVLRLQQQAGRSEPQEPGDPASSSSCASSSLPPPAPAGPREVFTCPVCFQEQESADLRSFNTHVDECLSAASTQRHGTGTRSGPGAGPGDPEAGPCSLGAEPCSLGAGPGVGPEEHCWWDEQTAAVSETSSRAGSGTSRNSSEKSSASSKQPARSDSHALNDLRLEPGEPRPTAPRTHFLLSPAGGAADRQPLSSRGRETPGRVGGVGAPPLTCPVCNTQQDTSDLAIFNRHVDVCLNQDVLVELGRGPLSRCSDITAASGGKGKAETGRNAPKPSCKNKRHGSPPLPASKKAKVKARGNTIDKFFR